MTREHVSQGLTVRLAHAISTLLPVLPDITLPRYTTGVLTDSAVPDST